MRKRLDRAGGETDFVTSPEGCRISKVCPTTGCRGEDVTRITELVAVLGGS